jgi:hypothetical protein
MKRLICMAVLGVILSAGAAAAQGPTHPSGALGFHNTEAPIGIRWWLSGQKIALDAGVGFGSHNESVAGTNVSLSNWALDLGLPIALKTWDKVRFIVRPGILYLSQEAVVGPGTTTDTGTDLIVSGELEAEVFLAENVSISASHGIAIDNVNPAGGGSSHTDWSTFGANFTQIGFHVYLFGK